ncbi:MAG: TetR/AcrR family transcriptional regulator, hemagglutinin/protease regulatory protein [Candidatus Binatota bacterium]|jgi:AcrR family transcriptional regulator|nr:TetR/AcrR family transcriptional regulator, hemagglutinin/protease regulatory protein [Candidatus Binatota bacterium]
MDPAERRRLLVRAAMRAAGFRSLAGVTTDDVAREGGVSRAAVLKYFPDRDAIVSAVLDEVERSVREQVARVRASTDDAVRLLVNLAVAYGATLERGFDYASIMLSWSTLHRQPRIAERLARIFLDFVALADETIRLGIRQKKIPPDIDIELAAWTFVGYFSTIASAKQFGRPPEWIYHLQIALLRNLFGSDAVDRVLTGAPAAALTSKRSKARTRR